MTRTVWSILGLAAVAAGWAGLGASMQLERPRIAPAPPELTGLKVQLPAISVDKVSLAFLLGHGAGWRAAPEWERVWTAAGAVEPLASRLPAWDELARSMDRSAAACFDDVLGVRAGLVVDNAGSWAAVSDMTDTVLSGLESALKSAPRGIAQGQQVSLIDRGRFSLVKLLASDGKGLARLSLHDSQSVPEPERVAEALAGLDSVIREVAGDSVLGSAAVLWSGKVSKEGVSRVAAGVVRKGATAHLRCLADSSFFDLDPAAVAALAARKTPPAAFSEATLFGLRGRLPASIRPAVGETANAVRTAMALLKTPLPDPGVFGQELLIEIERPSNETFSLTAGLSVFDAARAAEQGDRLVTSVLGAASRAAGAEAGVAKLADFDAKNPRDPLAIRLVTFDGAGDRSPTTFAWACFASEPEGDGVRPGWFVFHMRTGDASRDRTEQELRRRGALALLASNNVLSITLRPGAVASLLESTAPEGRELLGGSAAWIELAKNIDIIEAGLVATQTGHIEGSGRIVAKTQ